MHERVENILIEELNNEKFYNIWTASDTWATNKLNDGGTDLTLNHFKALFAHTSFKNSYCQFYHFFMNEVRNSPEYPSGFHYRALHFFLSDAIRILKQKQRNNQTASPHTEEQEIHLKVHLMMYFVLDLSLPVRSRQMRIDRKSTRLNSSHL